MNSRRERTGLESTGCMVAFIPGGVEQAVGPLVPYCAGPQVIRTRARTARGRLVGRRCWRSFQPAHGFDNRCIRVQIQPRIAKCHSQRGRLSPMLGEPLVGAASRRGPVQRRGLPTTPQPDHPDLI